MVAHLVAYQEVLGYAGERAALGKGEANTDPLFCVCGRVGARWLAINYQISNDLNCPHDLPLWVPATMFVQKDPRTLDQG